MKIINNKMVEETQNSKSRSRAARPKVVYLWQIADVVKWLKRHCSEDCALYAENFVQHEITGKALVRLNDNKLIRLGVANAGHRKEILRQIYKTRLKTDLMEVMDMERQINFSMYYD